MAFKKILDMAAVVTPAGTESLEVAIGAGLPNKKITAQQIASLAPAPSVNPTNLVGSLSTIPLSARPYFGFNARNNVGKYGGFDDGGSLLVASSFGTAAGATLYLRSGRRIFSFFTESSPGAGLNQAKFSEISPGGQFRRPSGGSFPGALFAFTRFGYSHAAITYPRFFCGYTNSNSLNIGATDNAFNNMTNVIGVGKDDADTNVFMITNDGSGVITKINTGFTYASLMGHQLGLAMYSKYDAESVRLELVDLENNVVFANEFTANLPVGDQMMLWHYSLNNGFHIVGGSIQLDAAVFDHIMQLAH